MNTHSLPLRAALFFIICLSAACTPLTSAPTETSIPAELERARKAYEARDYQAAMRLLRPLAEQGNAVAQKNVGFLYGQGWGVNRDFVEALKWFRLAADQGSAEAQYFVGAIHADGRGVSKDYSEAAKWFRKSAEQGYPPAQTALGTLYGRGDGVPQDHAEAMNWYRKSADKGDSDAQWRLGAMYAKGQSVPIDYAKAENWFRKAALQGDPHGQFWLGHIYLAGLGVNKDVSEATKWFKQATADDGFKTKILSGSIDKVDATALEKQSLLFMRALAAPPEALALSYLAVSYDLKLMEIARGGATVHITIGGKSETVNKTNADTYVALFNDKLSIYANAIQQRTFRRLANEYDTNASPGCDKLGFSPTKTVLVQDGFKVQVAHGPFQGKLLHRGVVVESALVIEHAMDPNVRLVGKVERDRIELSYGRAQCVVTLTAK